MIMSSKLAELTFFSNSKEEVWGQQIAGKLVSGRSGVISAVLACKLVTAFSSPSGTATCRGITKPEGT